MVLLMGCSWGQHLENGELTREGGVLWPDSELSHLPVQPPPEEDVDPGYYQFFNNLVRTPGLDDYGGQRQTVQLFSRKQRPVQLPIQAHSRSRSR